MRVVDRLPPAKGSKGICRVTLGNGDAAVNAQKPRGPSSSSDLYAILDLILDKGLVADVGLVKEDRSEANAVFRGTAEDLRRADKVLSPASPGDGDRRRLDVAHYVLDVRV